MKTSIFKSLLILTTLVIPIVGTETTVLAGGHNHAPKQHCHFKLNDEKHLKGKTTEGCVVVDAEAGDLTTKGKKQSIQSTFILSETAKKHLEVKYRFDIAFVEDTNQCRKEAKKASKKKYKLHLHKHKHKHNNAGLIFTNKADVKHNKKCTIDTYNLVITEIKEGILGNVTQGGTEPEPEVKPEVTVSTAEIVEGDDNEVMLEFKVKMKGKHSHKMKVKFKTHGGTATVNEDFVETAGELEFEATDTEELFTKIVRIPVIGDFEVEEDETLELATTLIVDEVDEPTLMTMARIIDNDVILTVSKADQISNLRQAVFTEARLRLTSANQEHSIPISGLDLDADGDEDVIVIYALPWDNQVGELVVYRNDNTTETGWIAEPTGIMTNAGANTILVSDFNGDGLDDVFIVNPYYTDNHVALMQVSGSLVQSNVIEQRLGAYGSKGYSSALVTHATGDLDNDGDIDIYLIGQSDPQNRYTHGDVTYINDGAGNFTPEHRTNYQFRNISNTWKFSAEIADFNGDGTNEIFIGTNGYEFDETQRAGHYNHLFGNNNMLMGADGEIIDSAVPRVTNDVCDACQSNYATIIDVESVDINGDGWMDVITQSFDSSTGNESNARIDVYLGNNNGTFDLSQSLKNGTEMDARLALEDVNGDGYLDLVGLPRNQQQTYFIQAYAGSALRRTESVVYINDGGGYFTEADVTIDQVSILSGMFFMTQDEKYIPAELKQ